MSKRAQSNKPSKSRSVFYSIDGPFISHPRSLLEKALKDGIISQFYAGRCELVWFEGPPGKQMRELRNTIQALSKVNS